MPTETQHLEQRVAALQSDLNERDQRIDDLTFSDNDRELSRRSWFDEAKRLEKECEGLRAKVKLLKSDLRVASDTVALGASAEPSKPVERDERAEFEQALRSIAGIPGDSINYHATHMSRIARAALERKPPSPTVKSQNLHDLDDDPYFIQQVEPHDSEGASHE